MTDPHGPSHPRRPNPVRPSALDRTEFAEAPAEARPASPDAVRNEPHHLRTGEAPAAEPRPCPACGYDLRGRPGAVRCPECGSRVPRALRLPASDGPRLELRETLSNAWRGLAVPSLAPVVLLTPLPSMMPFGPVVALAAGFAPAFRLLALRHFSRLPEPLEGRFRHRLAAMQLHQKLELAFVGSIALIAIAWTVGLSVPGLRLVYECLLVAWWAFALVGVARQLRVGTQIAEALVDPSLLPARATLRARRIVLIAAALGVVGSGASLFSALAGPLLGNAGGGGSLSMLVDAIALGGGALALVAATAAAYGCFLAHGHAGMVAECIFESELLRSSERERRAARSAQELEGLAAIGPDPVHFTAGGAPIDHTPPPPKPDDDAPIPLA